MSALVLAAAHSGSVPLFVAAFTVLFALTGVGNGSVYKMIPAIFHAKAAGRIEAGGDFEQEAFAARRLASALVGVAGAVGAFGGVLVQIAFRQSFLSQGNGDAAYLAFVAFYALCAAVTWAVYVRPSRGSAHGV